jgi:acid phosphatase type 7
MHWVFPRRASAFVASLFFLACSAFGLQTTGTDAQPELDVKPRTAVFFAFGDTRFTDPTTCELSDQAFRTALVDHMAHAPEKPDFLIMTGDIVLAGGNEQDWRIFEQETKSLKDEKIPIFPVLGNHDIKGASGQSKFVEHFDELKSHVQLKSRGWYLVNYGNAQLLMLDSQSAYDEHSPQGEWLRKKLKSVPEELAFLFVVLHHPLVTHASRIPFVYHCDGRRSKPALGHDVEDAEERLKSLLQDFSKTHPGVRVIVISGHNHNYERYVVNGTTYIVTGGGGATPYRINRYPSDFYHETGATYHYCKFAIHDNFLTGWMYRVTFEGGAAHWEQKDKFELQLPAIAK